MTRRPVGLGPRLFLAQGLVVVAGALTLLGVTLMLAPGLFEDHLSQMPEPVGAAISTLRPAACCIDGVE